MGWVMFFWTLLIYFAIGTIINPFYERYLDDCIEEIMSEDKFIALKLEAQGVDIRLLANIFCTLIWPVMVLATLADKMMK